MSLFNLAGLAALGLLYWFTTKLGHRAFYFVSVIVATIALSSVSGDSGGAYLGALGVVAVPGALLLLWVPYVVGLHVLWSQKGGSTRTLELDGKLRTIYFEDGDLAVDTANQDIRLMGRWYPAANIKSAERDRSLTTLYLNDPQFPLYHYHSSFKPRHERLRQALKMVMP